MTNVPVVIAQLKTSPSSAEWALQQKLNLALYKLDEIDNSIAAFFLKIDERGLALHSTAKSAPGELRVDFSSLGCRASDSLLKQNLLKAVGARKGKRPKILDATAGLGSDSFLLAYAGCSVVAIELNPIVFALLEEGVLRYKKLGVEEEEVVSKLSLQNEDFVSAGTVFTGIQVVYLDPMFPLGAKSAQAKKGMFYLQELVGENTNGAELFDTAIAIASERIVVKRAKKSPLINAVQPNFSFRGSSSRFDVYLLN